MTHTMTVENAVRALAGGLTLIGLVLGLLVNPWFFAVVAFVGLNLLQSAYTGFCPAEKIFTALGFRCPVDSSAMPRA